MNASQDTVAGAAGTKAPPGPGGTGEEATPSRRSFQVRNASLFGIFLLILLVGAVTKPENFLTQSNFITILSQAAVIGIISVGVTFVIIGGGIDLSVGALVALAAVWSTTNTTQPNGPLAMVVVAVAVAVGAGLVNGLLIAYGPMVPFIATLAMLASARGIALWISHGIPQTVDDRGFIAIGNNRVLGLPIPVWVFIVVAVIGWLVLNRTTFGRRTFAVGGNAEAARLAGINVRRHTVLLYVLSGLCCGVAAVLLSARLTSGSNAFGNLYELDAIAAVIIGGTLLTGGRGTLVGSMVGVLIFTTLNNIFVLHNFDTAVQNIAKGVIIVVAVLFQARLQQGRRAIS